MASDATKTGTETTENLPSNRSIEKNATTVGRKTEQVCFAEQKTSKDAAVNNPVETKSIDVRTPKTAVATVQQQKTAGQTTNRTTQTVISFENMPPPAQQQKSKPVNNSFENAANANASDSQFHQPETHAQQQRQQKVLDQRFEERANNSPHTDNNQSKNKNAGSNKTIRRRPPVRFDRHFHRDSGNQLKLGQLGAGLLALLFTSSCWPNPIFPYCTGRLFGFVQLFTEVCVNAFFLLCTGLLALGSLFSVPDAYYDFNIPLLEKLYVSLAVGMYALGLMISLINLFSSATFAFIWLLQIGSTFVTFAMYLIDFWSRWKVNDRRKGDRKQSFI